MKPVKQITSLVLASSMVLSSASALAADFDLKIKETGVQKDFLEWVFDDETFLDVTFGEEGKYLIEYDKKFYKAEDVIKASAENPNADLGELVKDLTPVEKPVDPEEEELKVVEISAISKTNITVKLSKNAEKELTKDFFNVTGATVTSVEPGVTSNVYVLNIESLDGKKGTVTVNGKSKDYDFEAPVAAKAKVEKVTFDNYRQFRVEFSEVVDEKTATDPANYYFEIVEGDAAPNKLAADLGATNNLVSIAINLEDEINEIAFNKYNAERVKAGKKALIEAEYYWLTNLTAETVNGKTVVTIRLPEKARFANGDKSLEVKSEKRATESGVVAVGKDKPLIKDVTVNVAVRNVKTADGKRAIDTAVFPMLISDTQNPKLVGGHYLKKVSADKFEAVSFNPSEKPTLNIEEVEKTGEIFLEFDEPVKEGAKLYVNGKDETGALLFKKADGSKGWTYEDASIATINIKEALGAEFKAANTVHNIKVVGVVDLADNINIPSTIEFNVKIVREAEFDQEKPEVLDIEQVADNVFKIQWNRLGVDSFKYMILTSDGKGDLSNGTFDAPELLSAASVVVKKEIDGKLYSYLKVPVADKKVAAEEKSLSYDEQDFINRVIKIEEAVAKETGKDDIKGTQRYEKNLRLYKDLDAPVLDSFVIKGEPETYQEVKADSEKTLEVYMKDITPFKNGLENEVLVLNAGGTDKAGDDEKLKPIRVSYEKDGIVRSAEITLKGGDFEFNDGSDIVNKLTIDLSTETTLLDTDKELVEGATYTVEIPEGFFADPAKTTVNDGTKQSYIDERRNGKYGFTSLAIKATVTVPGKGADDVNDSVPQTSKSLITSKFEKSVNRDEITVQFKGSIDPKTLKDPSNYTLNGKTLAAWGLSSSDIQYVVNGADINDIDTEKYARFYAPKGSVEVTGDVEFRVENVANLAGAKMASVVTTLELKDNKAPEVIATELDGAKTIVLTFDEPTNVIDPDKAPKNFVVKVDGQIIAVEKVVGTNDGKSRTVKLELSQNISNPNAAITIEVVQDNNGNIYVEDKAGNKLVKGTKITVQGKLGAAFEVEEEVEEVEEAEETEEVVEEEVVEEIAE